MDEHDHQIRLAAFNFLDQLRAIHGDELPRAALAQGFQFQGRRVPLLGPQGIFKPAVIPLVPLSITTVPPSPNKDRPYEDEFAGENLIYYCYRGTDPNHRENLGLRHAMQHRIPLIYFFGITPGWYLAVYPAFVVGDEAARLRFTVDVSASVKAAAHPFAVHDNLADAQRSYQLVSVQQRLHQRSFRRRVLSAYREHCAICRLRHGELLDAAHIIPDTDPRGQPVVPNGLSLCKLHHAAFDGRFLGIRPDLVIEIRKDLLDEEDGPMLLHGLKGFHGRELHVPKSRHLRPDPDRLEERYALFRQAM
jgi:putative restriction endonuclease